MVRHIETGVFKPKSTRMETKADITTAAATAIIETEAKAREAKTARLRAARLAQEETAAPVETKRARRK